jgi:hypothetical protein
MKLEINGNVNYSAQIVEIKNIIPLEKCDNIVATIILGNNVIVSKDAKIGDIGIFFPIESRLSADFLKFNNLYRDKLLNADTTKGGFFELNGRIRCVKLRGNKSEGFFIPVESLYYLNIGHEFLLNKIGESFDTIDNITICEKYIIPRRQYSQGNKNEKKNKRIKKSRLLDNQFRFHIDTQQLYRNLHRINYNDLISITYKLHGSSFIVSNILCKRKLNIFEKILKKCKIKIDDKEYFNLYSSRKVIKNEEFKNENQMSFYDEDIWKIANDELKDNLQKGMTFYGEVVGYLSSGKAIQSEYDYGNEAGKHTLYIYRITFTNLDGRVFEFSMKQVQDFCKQNGINAVPLLYYGYVKDFMQDSGYNWNDDQENDLHRDDFLTLLKKKYLEKDCYMCLHKVPTEGVVVRKESNDIESFKVKSEAFYLRETKLLDKGIENIEDNQESGNESEN